MDIHRCRFVPYQPPAINALAFSHSSQSKQATPSDLKLAVGRENGNIEIWNPLRGNWTQERIFRGGVGRTIEQLNWAQDLILPDEDEESQKPVFGRLRLFSSGGSTSLTEWDLEKGLPKSHAEGNSDDIWCFAVQPQWTTTQARNNPEAVRAAPSQVIAAGCADGSIVLFSIADDGLRFDRILTKQMKKKSRCISLTWRDRHTVVAGFEESMIRVFDIRSRTVIRQMSLGNSREGSQVLVWTVKCLPNGTILSGDSSGELKVWDSENFSLVQRLKTHSADVLDITTNQAGTMILSCGVDRRTVAYAPIANQPSAKTQRWYEIRHRRFHEHDVKAITCFESKSLSIAVSGGMDTMPVVLPMKNWNEEYHRSLPHLPQKPQMSVSAGARLMLTWWARDLFIWHLPHRYKESTDTDSIPDDHTNNKLLAQVQLKNDDYITSAEISRSGNMIVAATSAGVRMFQLRRAVSTTGREEVRSRPIVLPKAFAGYGASTVGFSPDSKWLFAIRSNNVIVLAKVLQPSSTKERPNVHDKVIKLDRRKRRHQSFEAQSLGQYSRHITSVAFSSDSRILAVGDLSGSIDTWILEGHEAMVALSSPRLTNGDPAITGDSQSASDDSDSDSDSDDETDSHAIQGQKWIRTPSGSQLPNLENAVLAMAFKPSSTPPISPPHIHGNEGLHATRHNPHPISPVVPSDESGFLVAVTSTHQIVEFDTMNCRLSDWSRRNPSFLLPEKLRRIKDRVMGIWFDVCPKLEISRLWLYGANFIYMLDLTRDLRTSQDEDEAQGLITIGQLGPHALQVGPDHALVKNSPVGGNGNAKKRKRKTDGAGDAMRPEEKYSAKIRRVRVDDATEAGLPSPPRSADHESDEMDVDDDDDDDDDDDGDEASHGLVSRRRTTTTQPEHEHDEHGEHADQIDDHTHKPVASSSWSTFQYRGIFGICTLQQQQQPPPPTEVGDPSEKNTTGATVQGEREALEVVVVERPLYDVELAPRFSDGQDW